MAKVSNRTCCQVLDACRTLGSSDVLTLVARWIHGESLQQDTLVTRWVGGESLQQDVLSSARRLSHAGFIATVSNRTCCLRRTPGSDACRPMLRRLSHADYGESLQQDVLPSARRLSHAGFIATVSNRTCCQVLDACRTLGSWRKSPTGRVAKC
ncbi:hypothetical protein RRG08_059726 [Elysia crispata]|uniref:Uncharacterized protein n=1 Tax=Elysia crispata TaxID=231223 RepID=A0AAE0YN81_9GAST|nr:hypothetical protein RRG08_059726 [Elysia crispata]